MNEFDRRPLKNAVTPAPGSSRRQRGVTGIAILGIAVFALTIAGAAQTSKPSSDWHTKVTAEMPLLGHRNWILVVDSAYPLQTSPGVETIETNQSQEEVVKSVLQTIHHSIQVRPVIYMDAELPQVSEADAPGVSAYRTKIAEILHGFPITSLPHEQIIGNIDEVGKTFHVLVLKTNMTIPYTSIFIRLDCKYWSAEDEARLRSRMANPKVQ